MKTKLLFIAVFIVTLASTSCSSNDNNNPVPPAPTTPTNGFSWKENGGTTVKTAPTASFTSQYKTLFAKNASAATVFEINLSAETTGTYTLGSANALSFVLSSGIFQATSGNVIITANANGKMSGTFQATGTAVDGITSVNGTFTNIAVVP